jgi:hypothetical protein
MSATASHPKNRLQSATPRIVSPIGGAKDPCA